MFIKYFLKCILISNIYMWDPCDPFQPSFKAFVIVDALIDSNMKISLLPSKIVHSHPNWRKYLQRDLTHESVKPNKT